ncbi:hypothetical protein AO385_1926 [Moraxella catarrhalis]|uniref:Uncharacterized protein n=1 Tax=Moraxella catarrhalis TaxID=480 RepID=A0A198UDJ9_MORCA|nr:hypothetical protein AO384_1865 [Moraxella catarrhalis]OAU95502.1 hypothetical protein AO385_1926 [Moraxella catarrhalis]OAU96887.1 hypothetical protein AO383_1404 [Moraxella catarrhalis]
MVYFTASTFIFQRKFDADKLGLFNSKFIPISKPQRFHLPWGLFQLDQHPSADGLALAAII